MKTPFLLDEASKILSIRRPDRQKSTQLLGTRDITVFPHTVLSVEVQSNGNGESV
jgi:hypothetical protein